VIINNAIATNAVPSLKKSMAKTANLLINTPQFVPSINVNLKNVTVTSNSIEIPVNVEAKETTVSALQFEFTYDPKKLKFESIANELPNTWFTFVDNKEGRVKFGSIDKDIKNPITGNFMPFKLKFSTLANGLDINSFIRVTPNMDASSKTGYQLGINLSTDVIKLTGYNNF
jgi:hypothetical protein